jgi:hypothetical protein
MDNKDVLLLRTFVSKSNLDSYIQIYQDGSPLTLLENTYLTCRNAGDFDDLQEKLWSRSKLNNDEQLVLAKFNQVLNKLTPYLGNTVYRLYANSHYLELPQFTFFKENTGKVFEILAFIGTSTRPVDDEDRYVWEIQLSNPSNNRSLLFENFGWNLENDTEREILFLQSTKFRIIAVNGKKVTLKETNEPSNCCIPVK